MGIVATARPRMWEAMEEDVSQRRTCSRVEGRDGERVFMVVEAWFPSSWDLVRPPRDFEASALRLVSI